MERSSGSVYRLTPDAAYVLRACDGETDLATPAFLPRHRRVLAGFVARGVVVPAGYGVTPDPVQAFRRTDGPFLTHVLWAVTSRCNLHCRHCYMDAAGQSADELILDDARRVVRRLATANIPSVGITGGEPLVRADLDAILRALVEEGIHVADLFTNGILASDERLEGLRALGLAPRFHVSFDGCGRHDHLRGARGSEELVLAAIGRIRRAGFEVYVGTCVDAGDAASLLATYETMRDLDVTAWGLARPQPTGRWRNGRPEPTVEEMAAACTPVLERWRDDGRPMTLGLEAMFSAPGAGQALRDEAVAAAPGAAPGRQEPAAGQGFACQACRRSAYVDPAARLMPCIGYSETDLAPEFPSLLELSVAEAWDDSRLRDVLDVRRSEILAHEPACAACVHFAGCGAGCRASAYVRTGDLLARDPVLCATVRSGVRGTLQGLADA